MTKDESDQETKRWFQRIKKSRKELTHSLINRLIDGSISGADAARCLSDQTDGWLVELFDDQLPSSLCTVVAIGGYGRQQLAPQSDLDLQILVKGDPIEADNRAIEQTLYQLWDAGFKVGYSVRTMTEALKLAKENLDTKTAFLQSRHLWGDPALTKDFQARIWRTLFQGKVAQFAEQKLAERDARRAQPENSRMALEPNIKEGSGGLRDIHALQWISQTVFCQSSWAPLVVNNVLSQEQLNQLIQIEDWQLCVRFHLHHITNRAEERLTFDLQAEIASLIGYDYQKLNVPRHQAVERFMHQYYLHAWTVKIITEIALDALKEDHARGGWESLMGMILPDSHDGEWRVRRGQLMFGELDDYRKDPLAVLRLFLTSVDRGMAVHPKTLQMITSNQTAMPTDLGTSTQTRENANALLLEIITHPNNPVATLRLMSDTGVLMKVLPEWEPISGLMQFNRYHHYTVDAHTLRALEWMHVLIYGKPEKRVGQLNADQAFAVHQLGEVEGLRALDDLAGREHPATIAQQFSNHRILLVAILMHDLMKGREGDHSVLGAEMVLKTCPRLGLTDEETRFVSWLVAEHLTMSNLAFKRDLEDTQTIETFANHVGSVEHLDALYVLTVCDISAVGPDTWTSWKAALLHQLYQVTKKRLQTGQSLPSAHIKAQKRRKELRKALLSQEDAKWTEPNLDHVLSKMSDDYLAHVPLDSQMDHAALIRESEGDDEIRFSVLQDPVDRWTEITVYCLDHHGLFAEIVGAINVSGYSIESVRAYTLHNGMALDSFAIRTANGFAVANEAALKRLKKKIKQVISGDSSARMALKIAAARPRAKRLTVLDRPPTVHFYHHASDRFTVMELERSNDQGELYRVSSLLTDMNIQIHGAKISGYGNRFVDSFYLCDDAGDKLMDEDRLELLKRQLLEQMMPNKEVNESGQPH